MMKLLGAAFGGWGHTTVLAGLLAGLVVAWQVERWSYGRVQHQAGKQSARVVIEKANEDASTKAEAAAAAVVDPRVRGVRDPNAVDR